MGLTRLVSGPNTESPAGQSQPPLGYRAAEEAEKAAASGSETYTLVRQGKAGRLPREMRRGVPEKKDAWKGPTPRSRRPAGSNRHGGGDRRAEQAAVQLAQSVNLSPLLEPRLGRRPQTLPASLLPVYALQPGV